MIHQNEAPTACSMPNCTDGDNVLFRFRADTVHSEQMIGKYTLRSHIVYNYIANTT